MTAYTDFDQLFPGLFQGSYPKLNKELMQQFDTVVYCAVEKQPKPAEIKTVPSGKHVIGVPLDDDPYQPITREQAADLIKVARQLAAQVRAGKRVLITCMMGMNRSGLMSALTLMLSTGCTGSDAAITVSSKRRPMADGTRALFNPMFARFIKTLPPIV
jgi:protein-tyrosine phosphatase